MYVYCFGEIQSCIYMYVSGMVNTELFNNYYGAVYNVIIIVVIII